MELRLSLSPATAAEDKSIPADFWELASGTDRSIGEAPGMPFDLTSMLPKQY